MKLKSDENLPHECAEVLTRHGHDALTILDQNMQGEKDPEVAQVVRREGRALLTLDVGFGDIRRYPPGEYHGLLVLRLSQQDKPSVLEVVERLAGQLPQDSLTGELWIIDEETIRAWSDQQGA